MPRHLLVAGIDFGTSFTKIVIRDNNTPGSLARVVTFSGINDGLLPSTIGFNEQELFPPAGKQRGITIPYLKMLGAHVANGTPLQKTPIRLHPGLRRLTPWPDDRTVIRNCLAFYFAHVIAATEQFIRHHSPWRNFNLTPGNGEDFLVFQLAVPTGLMNDSGASEILFREALIAGYEARCAITDPLHQRVNYGIWSKQMDQFLSAPDLGERFKWQCLIYPEVAAAVQTVFRSPSAANGLYVTMDVGAGTVDLNVFHRFNQKLEYYAAIVCPLGIQNLDDPHHAVRNRREAELMKELRDRLSDLYIRASIFQPNHGHTPGMRTWDRATYFIFGGGAHHLPYREAFKQGIRDVSDCSPNVHYLSAATNLVRPGNREFGRFAVAYGLSFYSANLEKIKLPHTLRTFYDLHPELRRQPGEPFGQNWDD